MNQYKADWKEKLNADPKPIYDKQPRLDGVKVSILFIPEPKVKHHDKEFAKWWMNYLEDSGGDVTTQHFYDPVSTNQYDLDLFIPITG